MQRCISFTIAFLLLGSGPSLAQDEQAPPDGSTSFAGKTGGERRELVAGSFFCWCPAGTFVRGARLVRNRNIRVESAALSPHSSDA